MAARVANRSSGEAATLLAFDRVARFRPPTQCLRPASGNGLLTASCDGVLGVDANRLRSPVLVGYYQRYLNHQDSSIFINQVTERYQGAALERLVATGDCVARRAAVLALSCIGDYASNAVFGRALVDRDRGVRSIAAHGLRELWCR